MFPVVAIDGTAASGKSTVSRQLAQRLNFVYVNTGEMYRGVTWWMLEHGVAVDHPEEVKKAMTRVAIECRIENKKTIFRLDGIDPSEHCREARVNEKVSIVSAVPDVRRVLVECQRALAKSAPLVMEGRDIGTVVFKETPYQFYIDADPAIRAQRRRAQGEVDVVTGRDLIDSTRKTSPLTLSAKATLIDSGNTTVEENITSILEKLKEQGLAW